MTDTFMAGVSIFGNTVGDTGMVSNQLVFAGGNNITLSQGTDSNGATVTISALNQSEQTQDLFDLTLSGNTSGALALVNSGTLTLVGGNNITLSQNGNAITVSGQQQTAPTVNFYHPFMYETDTIQMVNGSMYLTPVVPTGDVFPGNMTVQTFDVVLQEGGFPTQITNANTVSFFAGLYTMNNSTLSLASSAVSTLAEAQNVSNSKSWNGQRHLTIASSLWNTQPMLTQGAYWLGMMVNQSGAGNGMTFFCPSQAFETHSLNGTFGNTVTTTPEVAALPYAGAYSVTSASLPTSLAESNIIHMQSIPHFAFNNYLSAY